MLGSDPADAFDVLAYGAARQWFSVNNPTPYNHGGASVLCINNGGNETWVDTGGAIHQLNTGVQSQFQGSIMVGPNVYQPDIAYTGYLLQVNGPNTAYQPLTLGGGHAGSLNVITTPTIGAPASLASATPGRAPSATCAQARTSTVT